MSIMDDINEVIGAVSTEAERKPEAPPSVASNETPEQLHAIIDILTEKTRTCEEQTARAITHANLLETSLCDALRAVADYKSRWESARVLLASMGITLDAPKVLESMAQGTRPTP